MARPLRIEYEGALYHVLGRGNRRQAIFEHERDSHRFLELLHESSVQFGVELHAFVLMGNHFHLLARTRQANLSRWMHWLLSTYTIKFQRQHERVGHGHLFQGRFKSHLVEEGDYLLELSRYLHLNPVRGLVLGEGNLPERRARLRAFTLSSYAGYAGLRAPWPGVSEELILGEVARGLPRRSTIAHCRREYRRFVERGLRESIADPREELVAQAILGSESFVQEVIDLLGDNCAAHREFSGKRQLRGPLVGPQVQLELVLACVEKVYGPSPTPWAAGSGRGKWSEERGVAMTLMRRLTDLSYQEIGQLFGGVDYAAVAQRVRRTVTRDAQGRLRVPLAELQGKC